MESLQDMEERHARELLELQNNIKLMLKGTKKSIKAQIEAQAIQMQFDLKAKHREEVEELEELQGGIEELNVSDLNLSSDDKKQRLQDEEIALQKKAKSKKRLDKKATKEKEREEMKIKILASDNNPSKRELELIAMREQLTKEGYFIKDIPSDGNCLYRAVADQLILTNNAGGATQDFKQLRQIAATHIRNNAEEFAPFLGLTVEEVPEYCSKVASDTLAEWGGQVELKALCESLNRQIFVYSASAPVVKMGEAAGKEPLRLAFHRHFYALGEHYNSIVPVHQSCGCDC